MWRTCAELCIYEICDIIYDIMQCSVFLCSLTLCYIELCCVVLFRIVSCYVLHQIVLCRVVSCCVVLCCVVLCFSMICYVMLRYVMLWYGMYLHVQYVYIYIYIHTDINYIIHVRMASDVNVYALLCVCRCIHTDPNNTHTQCHFHPLMFRSACLGSPPFRDPAAPWRGDGWGWAAP